MNSETNIDTSEIVKEIMYPISYANLNELSKSVVSGSGKRISSRSLEDKDLAIIELLYNFKACSIKQIERYLNVKGYPSVDIPYRINRLSKIYSVANIMKFSYLNKVGKIEKIKVACLMGSGIHLIRNYTNYEIDEDISNLNKLNMVTEKRLGYDLKFILKTESSIDIYLDLLENHLDKIQLFDFRMKLVDLTNTIPFIPTDLLVSYKKASQINNLLIRGICDLEKNNVVFFVQMANSFNRLIDNQDYLNFHLPISNEKPRLLFVSKNSEILTILKKALNDSQVSLEQIDILHYSETEEYFSEAFKDDLELENLNICELDDYELVR